MEQDQREETRKTQSFSLLKVRTKMLMSCEGERAQICIQKVHKIKLKK